MNKHNFEYRAAGLLFFYFPEVYNGKLSPFYPYVLNTILDLTDCPFDVVWGRLKKGNIFDAECNTGLYSYQIPDKIFDILVDTAALHIALRNPKPFTNILVYTYILRLIGFIIFMITKNDKVFIFFPHLFQVFYVYFYAVEEFNIDVSETNTINLILLVLGKITHELTLHGKKK